MPYQYKVGGKIVPETVRLKGETLKLRDQPGAIVLDGLNIPFSDGVGWLLAMWRLENRDSKYPDSFFTDRKGRRYTHDEKFSNVAKALGGFGLACVITTLTRRKGDIDSYASTHSTYLGGVKAGRDIGHPATDKAYINELSDKLDKAFSNSDAISRILLLLYAEVERRVQWEQYVFNRNTIILGVVLTLIFIAFLWFTSNP